MVRAPCRRRWLQPLPVPLLPLLLVLLQPRLHVWATAPEPCELDDDDFRCACNFTDPEPDWSSAYQCVSAVEVEIRGGGRSLKEFVKFADTDPRQYADVVKALRLRRLTVGAAQVPALLLFSLLRGLGSSRLTQLTLEDLEIIGPTPPTPQEAAGPALSTLTLRNVSWAAGSAWLAELQLWLRPGLRVLRVAQAPSLAWSCADLRPLPSLTALDLSDNPGLDERALTAALCPHKFPALQELALRRTGLQTPRGVCAALAAAGVHPHRLDLSHNSLRATAPGAPRCSWPGALSSLNLSFAGLEQVPIGLPAELSVLDLSCNRLSREPRPEELPKVKDLTLAGNPFLDSKNSGVASAACEPLIQALGVSGTMVLLQGARSLA